ncbi:hypothetical protein BN1110_04567 [bacterium YEK0313]|nr:hypothetical protein BN1110_04567 [bacterium YEK0313]
MRFWQRGFCAAAGPARAWSGRQRGEVKAGTPAGAALAPPPTPKSPPGSGVRRGLAGRDDRHGRSHRRLGLCRRRLRAVIGELDGPGALVLGIDLEETDPVIAAGEAFLDAANGELLVARAHEGTPRPFAALIVVDCVEIIEARHQRTAQNGLATARGDVPPALRGPALAVLVADGDADPAAGRVAQLQIGRRRPGRRQPQGPDEEAQHCEGTACGESNH